jgi:tetratricopeptide (TPR) repeat protein
VDPAVTGFELDRDVKRELASLRAEAAEQTAKHLVMVGRLIDSDPETAHAHAVAARRLAPRLGLVREAVGLAAYHAGLFADALSELRAARRISGGDEHWPVLADCERALGRPERALLMAAAPEVERLDRAGRVEMRIVAAGARADLGQLDAAVVTLQGPELNDPEDRPWVARLRYAYAEALADAGRLDDARLWFARAADADPDGLTPAAERLQEIDGVTFELGEDDDEVGGRVEAEGEGDPPAAAVSVAQAQEPGADVEARAEDAVAVPPLDPAAETQDEPAADLDVAEEAAAEQPEAAELDGAAEAAEPKSEVEALVPAPEAEPAPENAGVRPSPETEESTPSTPVAPSHEALTLFSDAGTATAEPIRPPAGGVPAPWHDDRDDLGGETHG